MNLKIQNLSNSFKLDMRLHAQISGSTILLQPSRSSFLGRTLYTILSGDSFSKFPRSAAEAFVNQTTVIDFSTGQITGGDAVSPDFTPVSPATNFAQIGVISLDRTDRIFIRTSSAQSYTTALFDFENGNYPVHKGKIPLYAFLVSNVGGLKVERISDIRPDLNNIPFDAADVIYGNSENVSIGAVFREYLYADALLSQAQIKVRSTRLKRGDSISVVSSSTAAQNRTVLTVDYGSVFDTVTLDQNLTSTVTTTNNAYVTLSSFSDTSQVLSSGSRLIYDSNWRTCTTGQVDTLIHNLNMPLGTYVPQIFFSSTASMSGAVSLQCYAYSSYAIRIGAQIKLTPSTSVVRFGSSAIRNTINSLGQNSGTVSSGYYRLVLLGN